MESVSENDCGRTICEGLWHLLPPHSVDDDDDDPHNVDVEEDVDVVGKRSQLTEFGRVNEAADVFEIFSEFTEFGRVDVTRPP